MNILELARHEKNLVVDLRRYFHENPELSQKEFKTMDFIEKKLNGWGVDNGNPVSMERFKDEKRKAFYGKCLVVIQNDGKPGKAKLTATSEGLRQAVLKISAEEL